MTKFWNTDRITAYEAPRSDIPERAMRRIKIQQQGRGKAYLVQIPRAMKLPDLITYRGRSYAHRTDDLYTEASMWPIVEELDAYT